MCHTLLHAQLLLLLMQRGNICAAESLLGVIMLKCTRSGAQLQLLSEQQAMVTA